MKFWTICNLGKILKNDKKLDFIEIIPIVAYKNHLPAKLREKSINDIKGIFGISSGHFEEKLYKVLVYLYYYKLNDDSCGFGVAYMFDDGSSPLVELQKFKKDELKDAMIYMYMPTMLFEFPEKKVDVLKFDDTPKKEKEIEKILKKWKDS